MPLLWIVLTVLGLGVVGFVAGRGRAMRSVSDWRELHSLPNYYGYNVMMLALVPALVLITLWAVAQPLLVEQAVYADLPDAVVDSSGERDLMMADVRRVANGLEAAVVRGVMSEEEARSVSVEGTDLRDRLGEIGIALGSEVSASVLRAAQRFRGLSAWGDLWRAILVIGLSVAGLALGVARTTPSLRARISVERGTRWVLLGAACIAILTTVGIVLSLVFSTIDFFSLYPADDFFFGTNWSPSFGGGSSLGILPLLWGTLYISIIALLVAVPVGLLSAIYLSEYASPHVRSIAKPLLEVLAGIPTIVYGLFALLTVGPLLMSLFGDNGSLGLGWMDGGTAVMTAGLAMGILLVPFVSSLSDDIINAVPQDLRDGSLGLGATHSETVKQVILPAALPGIVGAILLAASRAIGETMIVVLGAGAAARLSLNPFDAMTTVTAKIVSQLTGDADFSSPEALVAFALGMTLFVITLCLNVIALWIVRRYREQYE